MGKTPNLLESLYSSDELLNRIWYASAYTLQMCLINPTHGRVWPPPSVGWDNSNYIGSGKSILVDGAKRDRTIWPGDMGISTMTAYTTLGDLTSSINSLATLYSYQNPKTGQLPYVGPMVFCLKPFNQTCDSGQGNWHSDMYHLWALKGTYDAYQYSTHLLKHAWSTVFRLFTSSSRLRYFIHFRKLNQIQICFLLTNQRIGSARIRW